jgi:hypothetical protein
MEGIFITFIEAIGRRRMGFRFNNTYEKLSLKDEA